MARYGTLLPQLLLPLLLLLPMLLLLWGLPTAVEGTATLR